MALIDNAVNYYKMEDTSDSVGSDNLTNTGMTNGSAKIGNGYSNDGTSGRYLTRSVIASGVKGLSFWYYHTGTVNKYLFKQSNGFEVFINGIGSIVLTDGTGLKALVTTFTVSNGNWYHIVITLGTTSTADNHIYVNGSDQTLSTNTYNLAEFHVGSGTLYIGNYFDGNFGINGKLDEIYFRGSDFSAAEVSSLYNSGNGFQYPFVVAPVAAFSADVTSGYSPVSVTFTDSSTNTPTSWSWNYSTGGAYTEFSTSQNPTQSFTTGTYKIKLTATNAGGSDDEIKTDYIVVNPLLYYDRNIDKVSIMTVKGGLPNA